MKKEKKILKIAGISIWRILTYFIIYSIVGYIIETLLMIRLNKKRKNSKTTNNY